MTPNLTKKAFVLISLFVVTINSEKCMRRGFSVQETLPLTSCSESLCPECDYCSDENGENSSISTKVDAQNGVLRVFYKLDLAKNYSDLLIRLQVSDELTGESCKRTDPVFLSTSFKIHSSKKVSLKWEPESSSTSLDAPCCKTLELNFKYIFTGCYYVEIFPHKDSNIHQPIEDCPKMYVTDYVKEPLMLMTPKLSPQYFSDSVQVSMNIRGEPAYLLVTLHSEKIRNIPFQGKKTCDRFSTEYACCYNHMYKTPMGGFECQSKMKSPETNCSVVNSKQGAKEVKCVFSHIKPGNYCISIKFDDERCVAGTTWETNLNGCLWRLRYEAKSSPVTVIEEVRETVELVPSNDLSGYIFAVLSVSIVVLMLLLLVMWKKYSSASLVKPTDRITTLREHLGLVKIEQPSVLLLYPRDSNTFMNAMAQFRKVLRRANCKVYDCWDPSMESEVMKSPHSWIQLHALDKSTRVIIVASQCSLLLERSVLGNSKVEYLYPSPFDDLFMYGIRCLNETTLTDCYEKMFVVRLRGQDDTSEVASLTYINPLTVFSLPLHLEKLILGLLSVDGSHYSIVTDFPEVRAFAKAVQENSWFMKENPNYLSSLMHSTNSCPEEELLQFS